MDKCKYCDKPLNGTYKKYGICSTCKSKRVKIRELKKLLEVIQKECKRNGTS